MKRLVSRISLFIVVLSLAIPALPLLAQQSQTPPEKKTSDEKKAEEEKKPKVTEEMVVTARKREETVQEVPISVAAPTESDLRDRGAETIEDVAQNVAGFTVQNLGPGQSQVAMRGVSSGQIVRDQPGVKEQVGVYLDESVISLSLFTPDLDLFDLSRVEILRGPQGTLFGSGSESGTVRYITNQPKIGSSESVAEATLESINNGGVGGSVKGAFNVPMGPTSAMRAVAYYTRYGGFIDAVQPNLSVKDHVNNGYRAGTRVGFLFKPNDNLSLTPRILYQKLDMNGWNRIDVFNILGNPYTTTRPAVQLGDHRQFTQIKEPTTDKFWLGDFNLSYNLSKTKTLTSVTSYSDRDILVIRDAGALTSSITGGSIGLPAAVYTLDSPLDDATKAKSFTEEIRLSGSDAKLQWVGGGFYAQNKRHYGQNLPVIGFTQLSGIPTAGTKLAKTDELYKSDLHYTLKQSALFGEATYSVTDRFDLTGGLRWYDFKEDRTQVFDGIFSDPNDSVGSTKAHGFAPRLMANFKVNDASRLYAQASKGFRLGGINDPLLVPLCTPQDLVTFSGHPDWKDETLWNYEVGSKNTVMGGNGSVNVAAFYSNIKDLQATVTAGSCSSRLILSVPKARSTGAEIEVDLHPSQMFDFSVSASHTDSKLQSTVTAPGPNNTRTIVSGIRSGARMPTVPQNQASAAATYHWMAPNNWAGYLTGTYQFVGDRFTQIGDEDLTCISGGTGTCPAATLYLDSFGKNTIGGPLTQNTFQFNPKLPSYNIVNLRVGVLRGKWDTAVFVNNVTNETAYLSLDRERGFRGRVAFLTNQPRTIGVTTRMNF
ncbi:MAG TPA: TonB-dependent receptor [Thermoanaerobaculia bacterium]|nr:TonB-dependent receptor [Thermoanaerobaculia bacterium]